MNHREMNPDEAIDRLLSGLREVELPQGMQQRVLRAVGERADARRQSSLQLPFTGRYSWMVGAASLAMVALAVSWTIARSHRTAQVATRSSAHSAPESAPAVKARLATAPIARPRPAAGPRRPSTEERSVPIELADDEDSLALSEMHAPSRPAPPMPLTNQEKLLVRIVRKGDPVELAMLDPGVRNSQENGERADFDRFFKQPPEIVEIKLPLNNQLSKGDEK